MACEPPPAPVLDESVLSRLEEALGGAEPVRRLVALFLDEAPGAVERLASALLDGRAEDAREAAHLLKSSAATVGLRRLSEICAAIEAGARDGRLESVGRSEATIRSEFANGRDALVRAIA